MSIGNNTEPLTPEMVATMVLEGMRESDVSRLRKLVVFTKAHEDHRLHRVVVRTLLQADRVDMAEQLFEPALIKDWCSNNTSIVVQQCPVLFKLHCEPTAHYLSKVSNLFVHLSDNEKVDIFQGKASLFAHAFLHDSLRRDPLLWSAFSPLWIGAYGSLLRDAAIGLGWNPSMLSEMVPKALVASTVQRWGRVFEYPHSVAIVAAVMDPDPERLTRQRIANQTKAWSEPQDAKHAPMQTNPWDTTLAQLLLDKTHYPYNLGPYKKRSLVDACDMQRLEGIVNMHVDLECLPLLLHHLVNNCLPGEPVVPNQTLSLPNLELL